MKVYVLMDHVCDADILIGVYSSRRIAKQKVKECRQKDRWGLEGPEIIEVVVDDEVYAHNGSAA